LPDIPPISKSTSSYLSFGIQFASGGGAASSRAPSSTSPLPSSISSTTLPIPLIAAVDESMIISSVCDTSMLIGVPLEIVPFVVAAASPSVGGMSCCGDLSSSTAGLLSSVSFSITIDTFSSSRSLTRLPVSLNAAVEDSMLTAGTACEANKLIGAGLEPDSSSCGELSPPSEAPSVVTLPTPLIAAVEDSMLTAGTACEANK